MDIPSVKTGQQLYINYRIIVSKLAELLQLQLCSYCSYCSYIAVIASDIVKSRVLLLQLLQLIEGVKNTRKHTSLFSGPQQSILGGCFLKAPAGRCTRL